jgi:hypothetical protein
MGTWDLKRHKSGFHNYRHNEIYTCDGYYLYSVEIIFTRSILHYLYTFSTHAWNALCRSCETLCWSDGALHSRCVSARRPQNGFLGLHPSVGERDGGQEVLNRNCMEDEGEESTPLLQCPVLWADRCAVWRCHASALYPYSCSAEPFEFVFLTSLMSAPIARNWMSYLSPRCV